MSNKSTTSSAIVVKSPWLVNNTFSMFNMCASKFKEFISISKGGLTDVAINIVLRWMKVIIPIIAISWIINKLIISFHGHFCLILFRYWLPSPFLQFQRVPLLVVYSHLFKQLSFWFSRSMIWFGSWKIPIDTYSKGRYRCLRSYLQTPRVWNHASVLSLDLATVVSWAPNHR